jgi:hypothetical protein
MISVRWLKLPAKPFRSFGPVEGKEKKGMHSMPYVDVIVIECFVSLGEIMCG